MVETINVNRAWWGLVLVHLAASFIASMMSDSFAGLLLSASISWLLFCRWQWRSRFVFRGLSGLLLLFGIYLWTPPGGQMFCTMNLIQWAYAAFLCLGTSENVLGGIRRPRRWRNLLLLFPGTILLYLISMNVNSFSRLFFTYQITDSVISESGSIPAAFLSLAVLPAIVEEIFFRGLIFRGVGRGKKAIVVSALCFALLHMNFNQISYAFVMGLLLAWIVWKTGNLLCSLILHLLFNSITILTTCFLDGGGAGSGIFLRWMARLGEERVLISETGRFLWGSFAFCLEETFFSLLLLWGLIELYCSREGISSCAREEQDHREVYLKGWEMTPYSAGETQDCREVYFKRREMTSESLKEPMEDSPEEKEGGWKPDAGFTLACILCLTCACLME